MLKIMVLWYYLEVESYVKGTKQQRLRVERAASEN